MAGRSESLEVLQETDQDILGWCHINFIKLKTYSALLPPKAYDSPRLWNEFMTHFLPYDSKTNIWANTVQILQKQALITTCNKHVAELLYHFTKLGTGRDMLRSLPRRSLL